MSIIDNIRIRQDWTKDGYTCDRNPPREPGDPVEETLGKRRWAYTANGHYWISADGYVLLEEYIRTDGFDGYIEDLTDDELDAIARRKRDRDAQVSTATNPAMKNSPVPTPQQIQSIRDFLKHRRLQRKAVVVNK